MKTQSTVLASVIALSFAAVGVASANDTDNSIGYSDLIEQTAFAEGIIEHTAFVEGIVQNSNAKDVGDYSDYIQQTKFFADYQYRHCYIETTIGNSLM